MTAIFQFKRNDGALCFGKRKHMTTRLWRDNLQNDPYNCTMGVYLSSWGKLEQFKCLDLLRLKKIGRITLKTERKFSKSQSESKSNHQIIRNDSSVDGTDRLRAANVFVSHFSSELRDKSRRERESKRNREIHQIWLNRTNILKNQLSWVSSLSWHKLHKLSYRVSS